MLVNEAVKWHPFVFCWKRKLKPFIVLCLLAIFATSIHDYRSAVKWTSYILSAQSRQIGKDNHSNMITTPAELTWTMNPPKTHAIRKFPWQPIKVEDLDCSRLFAGDRRELARAKSVTRNPIPDSEASVLARKNCDEFLHNNSFITGTLTIEERDYPLAYSMVIYKDAAQVLGLLRTIYRPQNFICIHVDHKSPATFRSAIADMAYCLDNVFLSSRSVAVRWGKFSVLEAELICMNDLMKFSGWKYFINLTGQEFPLKTNMEIIAILKALGGANLVQVQEKRWKQRWWHQLPVPYNLTVGKGSVHMAVNRHFVQFVTTSPVARAFRQWCKRIRIPDEEFFITLNINPQLGIPGTYNGSLRQMLAPTASVIRFKNWHRIKSTPCAGHYTRNICILTAADLPLLGKRKELFANKFHMEHDGILAMECLAEKLYNSTRDETLGKVWFNVNYYRKLKFLKRIIPVPT